MSCQISSVAETKRRGKDALPRKRDHILNSGTLLISMAGVLLSKKQQLLL